jgi:hypothetical protein
MDLLGDPLTTHPIQTGWKITIEVNERFQFGFINNLYHHFRNRSVWTWIRTWSDRLEQLPILFVSNN